MKKIMILTGVLFLAVATSQAATSNFAPANVSDGTTVREPRTPKKSLFGFGESKFWKNEMERSGLSEFGSNTKSGLKKLMPGNAKGFFTRQREAYLERNK